MIRLENKTATAEGSKVELAHWDAVREKRARFFKTLPERVGEKVLDPKVGYVLPIIPPIMKWEAALSSNVRRVSILTFTSKMSCASFSLAAGPTSSHGTCQSADLPKPAFVKRSVEVQREGGFADAEAAGMIGHRGPDGKKSVPVSGTDGMYICDGCYAGKGNYARLDSVQIYQVVRKIWVDRALAKGRGSFVDEMVEILSAALSNESLLRRNLASSNHFRIHDSGDFFSVAYAMAWYKVCRRMPDVQFWCPTRQWVAPTFRYPLTENVPPNLALRPSALFFGSRAPLVRGLAAGSTSSRHNMAGEGHWDCPAYQSLEGSCASACCRTCWDRKDIPVNYRGH